MNTPRTNAPQAPANDDLLALIRAVRLMWRHKWRIAPVAPVFTAGTVRQ